MAYTTPAEDAKRIRTTLKKACGWTSRQISVRSESFSMGSAINICIHDPRVDRREVENIAKSAESVRRCEMTGEILSGGNRYLSVEWSDRAVAAVGESQADLIARIAQACAAIGPDQSLDVGPVRVSNRGSMYTLAACENDESGCMMGSWINPQAPRSIANALLSSGAHRDQIAQEA